jgi:hypothetical protein
LDTLGEFIIDYQDESSELRKQGFMRHKVSLEDLTDFMPLIDEYGLFLVARLLLVAGFVTHFYSGSSEKTDIVEEASL